MSMLPLSIDRMEATPQSQARLVISLFVMLIVVAVSIFTFLQIDGELERSETVQSDNRTWVLAQLQVDIQNLQIALLRASQTPDEEALVDVRRHYDILYSRVELVRHAPTMKVLTLRDTDAWQDLASETGLLQRFLPWIDGTDAALAVAVPTMQAETADIVTPVREMIVHALDESLLLGDALREDLRRTLYTFAISLVVTLAGLTLLLTTIYRQARAQQRYAHVLELAVDNLRATIESARDAVLIINSVDQVIGANKAGEQMLGCEVSSTKRVALSTFLRQPEAGGELIGADAQMECVGAQGQRVPVDVSMAAVNTAAGDTFKIAFLRDMSQQLERERMLADASDRARKGEEAKDRFLAVMSHEMRTPLSGLLSATDLLETTTTLDKQQGWLMGIVKSCGLAALEQVNNILELTRLSASNADDYPHTEFCMNTLVREQVQLYHALALDRGNTLTLSPEDAFGCMVHAPMPLVRRILNNLLSNAIKFTTFGTIDVVFMGRPSPRPGYRQFTLQVRDSGIGIAEKDLEKVFHNFETLDSSYSRTQEGTGLGLGIAKLSAEAMGGTIQVESRVGQGTCFTVTFEAALLQSPTAEVEAPPSDDVPHRTLQILLAEDNEINADLMQRQLTRLGHQVITATDGIKAIAAAQRQRFDIILMDISMPHMDGVTATRHLHDSGILGETPIVALTAQASPDRIQMLCDAGMADVVTKPVPIAKLDRLMQGLVRHLPPATNPPEAELQAAGGLLDLDRLDELLEVIGSSVLQDMVLRFATEMEGTLATFKTALDNGNTQTLSKAAHKAAGAAGMLTMDALCAALRDMETAAESEAPDCLAKRYDTIHRLQAESLGALQEMLKAA